MVILLDIDGVLVTEPSWKKVASGADGFMLFNQQSVDNLIDILSATKANIVLTSTHRVSFDTDKWIEIFKARGFNIQSITKLNQVSTLADMQDRATEIAVWVAANIGENYVIIDDDQSINRLSDSIKYHWVATKPFLGIDTEAKQKALDILLTNQ